MIGSFVISPLRLLMFTPLEIMSRCSEAGLNFRIIPVGINAPLEFLTGFTEGILLRRLIRSLEDGHSMIPGRLQQWRLQTFLKKCKGFVLVFVEKDPRKPERALGAKIQHNMFYVHLFSLSSRFLLSNLVPDFTFPLMISVRVSRKLLPMPS
jgi:hypothetical protein